MEGADHTHDDEQANHKPIRSSARVRAAKERETIQQAESSKPKEVEKSNKRPRRSGPAVTAGGIVINEPTKDPKGKKRAASEPDSEEEQPTPKKSRPNTTTTSNQAASSSSQIPSRSSRARKPITKTSMVRKSKASPTKSKAPMLKSKQPGPSTQTQDDDVEMVDAVVESAGEDDAVPENTDQQDKPPPEQPESSKPDEDGDEPMTDPPQDDSSSQPPPPPGSLSGVAAVAGLGGLDEGTAAALFGNDFRSIGSYMLTLSSRLKTLLENIKKKSDPTTRLIALQELSELLSISTEDTLSGYFQIDAFVKELVKIMGGTGNTEDDDGDDDGEGGNEGNDAQDEDAALAAALAMSAGGIAGDDVEAQVLACRCLANLMEALPGCAHTVVYHGAVPVLCSKLVEIQYIDLAEQTLSTLEKISEEYPSAIVREGGLAALLNYLDFFSTNVQRTALQAAANCCRNASSENFAMIREVFPIIRNVLGYSDQRLVEFACLCVIRTVESFYRSSPELLDNILDFDTIKAINSLLLPAGGSPLVSPATYTSFLRVLASSAKVSPKTAIALLEADLVSTLYQILTGVLPPSSDDNSEQGSSSSGQGLGGGLADMAIMQNLAHRPKEQVEEALSLICELMPPQPKDGVFDHRAYSERALSKMIKARAKSERAAARASSLNNPMTAAYLSGDIATPSVEEQTTEAGPSQSHDEAESQPGNSSAAASAVDLHAPVEEPNTNGDGSATNADSSAPAPNPEESAPAPPPPTRLELLKAKPYLVQRFVRHILPILIDVYAASVALTVRSRCLMGLLKAVSFVEADDLKFILKVPMASFIGSILSSKDNTNLVIGALQLVELLLNKLPLEYRASFRREGVLHEIDLLSKGELTPKPPKLPPTPVPAEEPSPPTPAPPPPAELAPPVVPPTEAGDVPVTEDNPAPPEGAPVEAIPVEIVPVEPAPLPILTTIAPPPVSRRSSSTPIDPQDAIIIRARVINFRFFASPPLGGTAAGDELFESMQTLGKSLAETHATESEVKATLTAIATLFTKTETSESISSFELMQSGLVDGLLDFATEQGRKLDISLRQKLLLETFTNVGETGTGTTSSHSPLSIFVKRLQESLSRMETFEVVTISQGEDTKRGSTSMLARQLRLRLVAAEGTSVPRNCTNITVSIHAIATFQALHDYLRPRVARISPGGSRLSGMLAAFAASAGLPPGVLDRALGSPSSSSLAIPPPAPIPANSSAPGPSGSSSSAPPKPDGRRRSLRLSKKDSANNAAAAPPPVPADEASVPADSPAVAAVSAPPSTSEGQMGVDMLGDDDSDADDYVGDEFDAEVYEDEMEHPVPVPEKTVSLAVADDGAKVEAQTPDGTRVATPNPMAALGLSAAKASYASALMAKPTDWHLEFSLDDHPLPLDMTIYGAVHQQQVRNATPVAMLGNIWNDVFTIKFKKVPGPAVSEDNAPAERAASPMTTSVPDDAPHARILRLLRVLYKLNSQGSERLAFDKILQTLPESAFINNKLTAKLARQLDEPMIVASSCLPDWALDLPQHYPFLFPFATRFSFMQSTSFGYARLILKWQSQQTRNGETSRRDDTTNHLGRLQRQKVRISRNFLLESAFKVLELYGSSSSVLEVEYFDEVGTGLGPTLEFYSFVSREFARRNIKMWHDSDSSGTGPYVSHPTGLFPAPFSRGDIAQDSTLVVGKKRSDFFRMLGQFIAKALLDSRIIDISLNRIFLKLVLGEEVPLTMASLKTVDPTLANSLALVQAYSHVKRDIEANVTLSPSAKKAALSNLSVKDVKLEDLALDFTVPGYDIELKEGGKDITVDASNVDEYIREVLDVMVGRGVRVQAQAFREGFSKVFPINDLQSFSADELSMLFGNAEEDWSADTLGESIKADHGFNGDSKAIRNLLEIMSSYDIKERRDYLQFITGSPKLPIGGFRGLTPPLTVVRKPHEAPLSADDYLPSVMTCVNYLKLPEYSSKDVMKRKLSMAMKEGVGSFHLS